MKKEKTGVLIGTGIKGSKYRERERERKLEGERE